MTSLSDHDRSSTILSAEAGWAPPATTATTATTASSVDRRTASVVGAAVAAAICILIAAIGWQIAPEGWVIGIVGLPATTFLAWKMSPGVVAADRQGAVARAIGLTGAAALGVAGFGLGVSATDALTVVMSALGEGILFGLIGAVVIGIPVSVVVFPAALVWAGIVRRLIRRPA